MVTSFARSVWSLLVASSFAADVAADELKLVARNYYAYGYEDGVDSGVPNGFAYGMGGLEKIAYDKVQQILYGISEQGFITLIDLSNGPVDAPQLPIVLKNAGGYGYTDVSICAEEGILFSSYKNDPNPGHVEIHKVARRTGGDIIPPGLVHEVMVGAGPDMIRPNSDCTILAVANEGEGDYDDASGLTNPEGSVSLIKGPFLDAAAPAVATVTFPWTDDELLERSIHLPLSENALEYWDDHSSISADVDFSAARQSYTGASVLEPEWLEWSADDGEIYVNLQENSALVKIDVATETAANIYSYGLKSWASTPIDVVEDGGCSVMPTVEGLSTLRSPDSIAVVDVGGVSYVITANEGDDLEYGDFEEKLKSKDIFSGSELGLLNATADPKIFDPAAPSEGQSKYFNAECSTDPTSAAPQEWCATSMRMSIGSDMIDYSNPMSPFIKGMVGIGGRGISIYKLAPDDLELVWDSADEFEKEGCAAYPWSHNGIQDEEFAAVNSTLYLADEGLRETIEEMNDPEEDGCEDGGDGKPGACSLGQTVDWRSQKDGPGAEAVVVGEACGKTYLVTVSEKNSVGYLYDISDITSPELEQVFHLSPASETKNPTVAYNDRTLGEIDAESILFLSEAESPTGVASVIFAGAWSSTTSYWDFECMPAAETPIEEPAEPSAETAVPAVPPTETNGGLENEGESETNGGFDLVSEDVSATNGEGDYSIVDEESSVGSIKITLSVVGAVVATAGWLTAM